MNVRWNGIFKPYLPTLSGAQQSSEKKYNRSREQEKTNVTQIKVDATIS